MHTLRRTTDPVVVIGLPRSGSSYFAHVLSALEDLWVFDDLYAFQKAEAISLEPLDDAQLEAFLDRLAWETRARVIWEQDFRLPPTDRAGVDQLERDVLARYRGTTPLWHEVTETWVAALADMTGSRRWGYKTPQDFLNIDKLQRIWPDVQFLHLVRDPRQVLRSYKNLRAGKGADGDPRSYHPIVTSLYWKSAQQKVHAVLAAGSADVQVVRFEDLVRDPMGTAEQLAKHLDTTVGASVEVQSFNSSADRPARTELNETEIWICQKIVGDELAAAGYEPVEARFRMRHVPSMAGTTFRFLRFQFQRGVRDREKRMSILRFAKTKLQLAR